MKSMLSVALSLSLVLSAFGPGVTAASAAAMAAPVLTRTAPTAPVMPIAPLGGLLSQGLLQTNPGLTLPSLGSGLTSVGAPALQAVSLQAGVQAMPGAAPILPASRLSAQALQGPATLKAALLAAQGVQQPGTQATPFARTMGALSAETPGFQDMGTAASKSEAGRDFESRIGGGNSVPVAATDPSPKEVELIVTADEKSGRQLTADIYPAYLNEPGMTAQKLDTALQQQLMMFGITKSLLGVHNAAALGTIAKINTTVIRVPADQAASLMSAFAALGLETQIGRTFERPKPQEAEPAAKTVSLKQMVSIIRADQLQADLKKVLGEPAAPAPEQQAQAKPSFIASAVSFVKTVVRKALFGVAAVNPILPFAVLDSWAAVDHPFLKGHYIKSVDNSDDGEAHGTHTSGTIIGVDIFNFQGRNYNIFPNGSASEGDILFKLSMAQKDGALATSNSWGDGSGNPAGAIEKLFVKTAAEGMHHSVSAGNSGSRKNTIGGPAIAVYLADLILNGKLIGKLKRIKAIAASDADKKTAYFSSRGPGSPTTARDPQYKDYPQKPDESGVGVNLVAPVPKGATVPELGGPGESMSGTSMSNPGVFGGMMLLTRGILVLLKDYLPKLSDKELTQFAMDLARYSMTQTAQKVAPVDEVGDGFIDIQASFEYATKLLKDATPQRAAVRVHAALRSLFGFAPLAAGGSSLQATPRALSMTEFGVLNGVGVVGSIAAGFLMHAPILGILGAYVAPIPVLFAYVGIMRLLGHKVGMPSIRFNPGISFAGKQHNLLSSRD
ncbi:MAG: hypothetical protein A2X36_04505 [Elusimicrobia bacterium GWA2_69_24]|nr:MAG: hypothetical protein A2X36_04505 [Elusimicrobia bacterium GWA2_69_24]